MTEQDIIDLGFKKQEVSPEESGCEKGFMYYTLDISGGFSFISNANDEVKDGKWFIEFFDCYPPIRFEEVEPLKVMIETAKQCLKND